MSKKLVAYFSASGSTAKLAQTLAAAAETALYEIRPAVAYERRDLNWMDKKARSTVEMQDPNCRPELQDTAAPVQEAEVIFLGFPIWWYREPSIIDSFLDAYDFAGKTVVPFFTSGGSQLGEGQSRIEKLAKGAKVLPGKRFTARSSEKELTDWVASQAADAIVGAHDVAFFGAMQNYHLGRVFASNLGIMGTLCRTPTGEEAAAVAGHLTQGDCLVVASYSGGLTGVSMALVPQAKRRGATVVAVTNSERSPLGDLADHTLSYAPLEHRHTKVGTFYSSTCTSLILNALYASCCAKRFETSVKSRSSIVNSLRDLRPNDFADTFADKTAWPQADRP